MSGIRDELSFLLQGVGYKDQIINVTDTKMSDMILKVDLNTDQEFSACAVDSKLQSYFDCVVQNENMAYPPDNWIVGNNTFLIIIRAANIPG